MICRHGCRLLQSHFEIQELELLKANPVYVRSREAALGRGAGEEVGAAADSPDRLQLGSSPLFPAIKKKVKIILLGFT